MKKGTSEKTTVLRSLRDAGQKFLNFLEPWFSKILFKRPTAQLMTLFSYLDVIGHNGYISKIKSCIYFIHNIQWSRLEMVECKHLQDIR